MCFYISCMKPEAPTKGVLSKSCSQKFRNIYRKTTVLESPFNKAVGFQACRVPANTAKF